MSIPRFSVQQPVLVNLLAAGVVLTGVLIYRGMSRESMPQVDVAGCSIVTIFPGASPEEVEQLVTIPLEDEVSDVDGIHEITSTSREGQSFIWVEFEPHVKDVGRAVLDVTNEVNRVRDLPAAAERPIVRRATFNHPTLSLAVRGEVPERVLRDVGRELIDRLERIDGIDEVQRTGIRERQIRVEVDPDQLAAHGMSLSQVTAAVAARGSNVPAGSIEDAKRSRLVRGMARVTDERALEQVVLQPRAEGGVVRVGDVANVVDGFEDARVTARVNGEPAIVLILTREVAADALRISAAVREEVEDLRKDLPEGVRIELFGDGAREVQTSLGALYSNAALGLLMVLLILWLFVRLRNALMAALGIPVALAAAIIVMDLLDITINLISLFALILCLGVIVDDAIIIIENIYRRMQRGEPPKQAAIEGAQEVFWPVVSSTLTTCAAFLPLLLMVGVMGEFFSIIPKVVVAALGGSLVEAFVVLPSHMADWGGAPRPHDPDRPPGPFERFAALMGETYTRALRWALKRRKRVVALAYLSCVGLLALAVAYKDVVLFMDEDVHFFDVRVRMPTESSHEQTERVMKEVERRLLTIVNDDTEVVITTTGFTRTRTWIETGDHLGMATLHLVPEDERSAPDAGQRLLDKASRLFDDLVGPAQLEVVELKPGPPRGAPVAVRLSGDNLDRLADLAELVAAELGQLPGVRGVAHNHELGKRELQVRVDEERAAMAGLTPAAVNGWLRSAFAQSKVATTRVDGESVDIAVMLSDDARSDASRLGQMRLVTPTGNDVMLGAVADFTEARGPAVIRRRNRDREVMVTAELNKGVTSAEVNRALAKRLAPLREAHPDLGISLGGEFEKTNESLDSLFRAFILAAFLIYAVLASQFRDFMHPLVVMAAIPLALIGVTVGFFVSGSAVGLIALIGVVGLSGIVVNDSLVLVDLINRLRREEGFSKQEAVVRAARQRARPILLTSVTTIAGLMPLALGIGGSAPMLAPMATAISWGLTFSTVLILVLIPCMYMSVDTVSGSLARLLGAERRVDAAPDAGQATPSPGE